MGGVLKGNGVADFAIFAALVFIPGRYACPGWEWVPSFAIARGRMLAGYSIHVLGECHGGHSCLQRKGNKQHEEKGECAHDNIYERIYTLIFSLEFPTSGLGFPQHPRGPLSQRPTKRVGIWAWHVFVEVRAWTWVSKTQTELSLRDTPKPGASGVCFQCPVSVCSRACVCMRLFQLREYWLPITWVTTRPAIKQDLGFPTFGFCNRVHRSKFTIEGVNMHRHTRCMGVGGVKAPSGRVIVPPGSWVG